MTSRTGHISSHELEGGLLIRQKAEELSRLAIYIGTAVRFRGDTGLRATLQWNVECDHDDPEARLRRSGDDRPRPLGRKQSIWFLMRHSTAPLAPLTQD